MITYTVKPIDRKQAESIIKIWHYSHSLNGVLSDICFGLFDKEVLIGAMVFGKPAMANQWRKYGTAANEVIELRRLACVDDTPKNTESFFIGRALRHLKKLKTYKTVISYADSNYGHTGIIYKASNFYFAGLTSPGRVIIWNGKQYHDKAIRTKYKGQLKPFAVKLVTALKDGSAAYKKTTSKYIYTYSLV